MTRNGMSRLVRGGLGKVPRNVICIGKEIVMGEWEGSNEGNPFFFLTLSPFFSSREK